MRSDGSWTTAQFIQHAYVHGDPDGTVWDVGLKDGKNSAKLVYPGYEYRIIKLLPLCLESLPVRQI